MGCYEGKVKIEDEIMKAKLERIKIQMERLNQMKLLEGIEGKPIKAPIIPDYIEPKIQNNEERNTILTSSLTNKKKFKIRVKKKRSKSNSIRRKVNIIEKE